MTDIGNKNDIVLICCWYGDYPWYFPYFLHSCSFNPSVDFYIITDNDEIPGIPKNVIFRRLKLTEVKSLASSKLGFEVKIDSPYKLCDFKPAYGLIFNEIVESYDFWGHTDIDIVYGDIRAFMTDEVLKMHDVLSSRHDYVTGSFCLYRNTELINTLFTQSRDYKYVFSNSENFCFDECNYLFSELQNGMSIFDFPNNIQSMTFLVKKLAAEGILNAFFDLIILEGTPGNITWENGKIIYKNEFEAMFYHLIKFKSICKNTNGLKYFPRKFHFTINEVNCEY